MGIARPLAVVLTLAATAAPAHAATVELRTSYVQNDPHFGPSSISDFTFTAAAGEQNAVSIQRDPESAIRVRDTGAPLTAGEGCKPDGADVVCPTTGIIRTMVVELGDGADSFETAYGDNTIRGGPGADTLTAPGGRFEGGPGADVMTAIGSGIANYEARTAGVRVTLDDLPNDGEPGEGDNLKGPFDYLWGGSGDDLLSAGAADGTAPVPDHVAATGGAGSDRIFGTAGTDNLIGGEGDDAIEAGAGNDSLRGNAGADRLRGGDGADFLDYSDSPAGVSVTLDGLAADDGAPGERDDVGGIEDLQGSKYDDTLTGTDGPNKLNGYEGFDSIDGRGGDDQIDALAGRRIVGGPGADSIRVSSADSLELRDGETDFAQCGQGGAGTIDVDPFDSVQSCVFAALEMYYTSPLRTARDGRVPMQVFCHTSVGRSCAGTIRLTERGRGKGIGKARFAVGRWEYATVRVKLNSAGRRLRKTRTRVKVQAVAVHDQPLGKPFGSDYYDLLRTYWFTKRSGSPSPSTLRTASRSSR